MTPVIKTQKSWQNFVIIIILIILTGLLAINYNYYLQLTALKKSVQSQISYNNKTNQILELNTVDSTILNNDVMAIKNTLKVSAEQINNLQSLLKEFSEIRNNPDLNIKMLTIENLINQANIKLKLDYDIKTVITILNIANQSIQNSNHPDLINLRKKILNKISQLEQTQLSDLMKVTIDLEQFIMKIDKITVLDLIQHKLPNNQDTTNVSVSSDTSNNNNWAQVFDNLRTELFNLVRIRKVDDRDNIKIVKLLDEQQFNILKLYFKLRATQAIISLNQRDVTSYTSALSDLNANINFYFVNNEQLRLSLLQLLKSHADINLTPELPDLSDIYPSIKIVNIS